MDKNDPFLQKLSEGQFIEKAVRDRLQELLPEYTVRCTDQDTKSLEREEFSLVDVIVLKGDHPVLGIECKRSETKFRKCMEINGWDGDYNTPLNNTSLRKYKESQFPFWVININQFCHKAFAADLDTILKSRHDYGQKKKSGVIIYNIDSSTWMTYEDRFTLTDILSDIIRKELTL